MTQPEPGPWWEQQIEAAEGAPLSGETLPPHAAEIEQALIATLLKRNAAYDVVADLLRAEHFYDDLHQRVYAAIEAMVAQGKDANATTVAAQFQGEEERAGYTVGQYLRDLEATTLSIINGRQYAEIIVDRHQRRRLRTVAQNLWDYIHAPDKLDVPAPKVAEELSNVLTDVQIGTGGALPDDFDVVAGRALAEIEAAMNAEGTITGVPTGITHLDSILGGLHPTSLNVIGARPGMGKTAFGLTVTRNAAKAGKGVGFFSLEQSSEEVTKRLLAMETGISVDRQKKGDLTPADYEQLHRAGAVLSGLPIYVDDRAMTLERIRATARWWQRRKGLDLLVIDYLGLMEGRRGESIYERVSRLTRECKQMAKQLNVPVVLLSQLNRNVEQRDDKRPILADLRESGTIEQDADVIGFIYREYAYLKDAEPKQRENESADKFEERERNWLDRVTRTANVGDVLIRKNRHGMTGDVHCAWSGERGEFLDLDQRAA
jgi:replicative DNA helicase